MSGVSWESVIAVFGLAVPVVAALWEFVLAGRKRLGYRVQMDTTVRDSSTSGPETRVFQRMQWDGRTLADPSVVLLRIENVGWSPIVDGDYVAPPTDPVGVRIAFPGRRVVGMAVTERSDNVPRSFFEPDRAGFATTDGVISLPKVILNRRAHYKVLAVLDREESFREPDFPDPVVTAGVVGGVRGGTIKKTEYYPFASRPVRWLLALLVLVSVAQSVSTFARGENAAAAPLDCAEGTLHLSGSTAFRPVLELAAAQYTKTCPGARIPLTDNSFRGSVPGLDTLAAAGGKTEPGTDAGLGDRLAFSDGPKSDGRPQLLPRPVALSLFTLVVSEDTGVRDLSLKQVRDIYAGRITNWSQVKGRDLPIQLVSRHPGSGTRSALEKRVLDGRPLPAVTTNDCRSLDTGRPGRCEVGGTRPAGHRGRDTRRPRSQRGRLRRRPRRRAPGAHRRLPGDAGGRRPGRLSLLGDRDRLHLRRAARGLDRRGLPALPRRRGRQGRHPLPGPPPLLRAGQTAGVPAGRVVTGAGGRAGGSGSRRGGPPSRRQPRGHSFPARWYTVPEGGGTCAGLGRAVAVGHRAGGVVLGSFSASPLRLWTMARQRSTEARQQERLPWSSAGSADERSAPSRAPPSSVWRSAAA